MLQSICRVRVLVLASALMMFGVFDVVDVTSRAEAQDQRGDGRLSNPGLPGWCETPAADRKSEIGCYTTAITSLGELPREPLFWYLDAFPTPEAALASRGPRGTVVNGLGKHWLFTIAAKGWPATTGQRVAVIGPLVVRPGTPHTAHYMETVIPSGAQKGAGGHRHPGPEAWYVLEGGQCLETPDGVTIAQAGQTMIAPEGLPMAIASYGPDTRRAVVLILHRSDEAYSMPVGAPPGAPHAHWTPKGLCTP